MFDGFQKKAGLQIAKVPYRNTVQAATDLAEGRIQLMMSAYAILRPHVQSGKLRLLAITAAQRASMLPDVPTTAEAGFPDITIDGLVGIFGLRDMPAAVRERIAADVIAVLKDPAIAERLTATGQVVNPGGPAEFTAAIAKQQAQAAEAGKVLGIKPAHVDASTAAAACRLYKMRRRRSIAQYIWEECHDALKHWAAPRRLAAWRCRPRAQSQPRPGRAPGEVHPAARPRLRRRHRRAAARREARGAAGASRWWSRTAPAATASWRSAASSAPRTTTRCCSGRRRRSPRIPICTRSCPTIRATSRRSRAISATLISLAVPPSLNVKTLERTWWRWRRAQPGKLNWATVTGATDLILAGLLKSAGLDMAKVPYRDPVQAVNDVAEGRLHLYWSAYAIVRPRTQAGRVKIIATPASEPVPMLPAFRPSRRPAFRDLTFDGLVGLFGQRDMPLELRERIAADVKEALSDPGHRATS